MTRQEFLETFQGELAEKIQREIYFSKFSSLFIRLRVISGSTLKDISKFTKIPISRLTLLEHSRDDEYTIFEIRMLCAFYGLNYTCRICDTMGGVLAYRGYMEGEDSYPPLDEE